MLWRGGSREMIMRWRGDDHEMVMSDELLVSY